MNTRLLLLAVLVLISGAAVAQEEIDHAGIAAIKARGLGDSKVMEIARYMTDVNGPRLTNSPGYYSAAKYAMDKMKEWGFENVALESIGEWGTGWSVEYFNVWVSDPFFIDVIAYPKAWVGGIDGTLSSQPVLVDISSEADFEKYRGRLKSSIVMLGGSSRLDTIFEEEAVRHTEESLKEIHDIEPPISGVVSPERQARIDRWRLQRKVREFLLEEGVAAVLEPSMWDEHNIRLGSGGSYEKGATPGTPAFVVSREHYNRLARMIEAGKTITINLELRTTFHDEDINAYNVIGEIPGTDPDLKDEVVILGGHFDSWHAGTGAVDNASGSSVAMEAARLIAAAGLKPRRTIRVALWTAEEQGLHGSRRYVQMHYGDPSTGELKPDFDKFAAYFNMDNGTGAFRGIYAQGNGEVVPIFKAWGETVADMGFEVVTFDRTSGTDHLAFQALGLPGFQFIQDPVSYYNRNHHASMDVYDQLVPEDMVKNSIIMAVFAYSAAQRDEKLPRLPVPKPAK